MMVFCRDECVKQVVRSICRNGDWWPSQADEVAVEEPLEIRIGGVPVAVVMRTPGHDEDLVRGFLLTEQIVPHSEWIARIHPCSAAASGSNHDNVVQVILRPGFAVDRKKLRRNFFATSSCGICGKAVLEQVLSCSPPLNRARSAVDPRILLEMPRQLHTAQLGFRLTGGTHAAGLFGYDGSLLVVREDIGRHNAVDKALGWLSTAHRKADLVLVVSGRVSYEIVQKALAARIGVIVAVSAPSSLAIELAERSGITLAGFVRDESFAAYTHPEYLLGHSTHNA